MRKKANQYFSVALDLKGKPVKIIGAGKVAQRKILTLLETGADILVISPELSPGLSGLFRQNKLAWLRRRVRKNDLSGAKMIIAATDDQKTNRDVSRWAKKMGVLVNIVDNPRLSSFISPAILHKDKATIAIHTNGNDPVFSRDLKNFLKEYWDEFLSYRDRL